VIARQPQPAPELLDYLASQPLRRPMRERSVHEARHDLRDWAALVGGEPEPVAAVAAADADGVPARLYRPTGREQTVLVWLHGGAWMLGDLDTCDAIARALANRADCAVLAVDYRLAPEHRFPAAIEDAWAATVWAAEAFPRVAVGGDSAGGNLAAAVALRARDAVLPVTLQLLVYPLVDYTVETGSYYRFGQAYATFAGRPGFGPASLDDLRYMWEVYVPDPADRLRQDASPMRAVSLKGIAPAVVITAEHDIVRLDAHAYARWLALEGVPVRLHDYSGHIHGFFHMLGLTEAAQDAVRRSAAALREGLGRLDGSRRASIA
jgi:acetyl esterase